MRGIIRHGLLAAALACLNLAVARADDFPNRPITVMVGLAAGGITDVTARLYSEVVARNFGLRVSVENRPGAGGAVPLPRCRRRRPMAIRCWSFPAPSMPPSRLWDRRLTSR